MTARLKRRPCFVFVTPVSRTTLFGKKVMVEAAQVGVHRFRPKSVVPTALVRPHDVQCVARISLFASAQERTTRPVGRSSGFPPQLNSRGNGEEADAAAASDATATTLGRARQDSRFIVSSRNMVGGRRGW